MFIKASLSGFKADVKRFEIFLKGDTAPHLCIVNNDKNIAHVTLYK